MPWRELEQVAEGNGLKGLRKEGGKRTLVGLDQRHRVALRVGGRDQRKHARGEQQARSRHGRLGDEE